MAEEGGTDAPARAIPWAGLWAAAAGVLALVMIGDRVVNPAIAAARESVQMRADLAAATRQIDEVRQQQDADRKRFAEDLTAMRGSVNSVSTTLQDIRIGLADIRAEVRALKH